jgi:SAM-dependent methyltransferase
MNGLSPAPRLDKRQFYQQASVVDQYDRLRFGSLSGQWVNDRELGLICAGLPPTGRVLDLGCGTGRLSRYLAGRGYRAIALDTSLEMLRRGRTPDVPAIQADGFGLPFADGSFDGVAALRVAFHYADLASLLGAVAPVLRPGGRLVFDTYRWTPRSLLALDSARWGGKVFVHSPSAVERAARGAGFGVAAQRRAFLFSPYVYRILPFGLVRALGTAETFIPAGGRARIFWELERGSC